MRTLLGVVTALSLLAAACGDDDSQPAAAPPTAEPTATQAPAPVATATPTPPEPDLDLGLAVHYRFDGDATDELGTTDGVVFGASAVEGRDGTAGGALRFDGVDDYIEIAHTEAINMGLNFSITTWIRHQEQDDPAVWYTVFEKSDPERGGHSRYGAWIRDDKLWLCYEVVDNSAQPCGEATADIPYDEWTHIAAVRDGNTARLYIDGVETDAVIITGRSISQSEFLAFVGTDTYEEPGVFLRADLDDMRIYDRTLTPDEVALLASS